MSQKAAGTEERVFGGEGLGKEEFGGEGMGIFRGQEHGTVDGWRYK